VYRSTAHISGVMCFDSSACEVISTAPGHHEHLNDAPSVPIAQQESSFQGPAIAPTSRRFGIDGSRIESAALATAKAPGKRLGTPDPAGAVERMRRIRAIAEPTDA
jgi:hypothetical protein